MWTRDILILGLGERCFITPSRAGSGHKLRDCQGNSLGVVGTRKAKILVKDSANDEIIFRQNFMVSNVTNVLLPIILISIKLIFPRNYDSDTLSTKASSDLKAATILRCSS